MTIIKHSKRTMRRGCTKCGTNQLYWGHDTDHPYAAYCNDCQTTGRWVLLELDGVTPHSEKCGYAKTPPVPEPTTPPSKAEAMPPLETTPLTIEGKTEPTPTPGSDAFAAFQALVGAMGPKVDVEQIKALVKAEFANTVFPTRTVVERANGDRKEVKGKTHWKVADVTTDLLAGQHVLMVGPAGTGKSTIAEQAAEALGSQFYAISLSPMTPASQILGYMQAAGEYVETLYRKAYENGGVFHFDEFDNAHPSVLAVVNSSLANGAMAFPDKMVKRHSDFRCVASANTYGRGPDRQYVGRQQIDAATLDRFCVETIEVDEALETDLCHDTGADNATVDKVLKYVRKLRKNANTKAMTVTVSPRASIGMCALLAVGRTWDAVVDVRMRRGLSDQDWSKLTGDRLQPAF